MYICMAVFQVGQSCYECNSRGVPFVMLVIFTTQHQDQGARIKDKGQGSKVQGKGSRVKGEVPECVHRQVSDSDSAGLLCAVCTFTPRATTTPPPIIAHHTLQSRGSWGCIMMLPVG